MDKYLKSFVIGSSYLVFFLFYFSVMDISPSIRNYTYEQYTMIAPIYLGMMNVIGNYLFQNHPYRYLLTGIISGSIVAIFATLNNSYNFTKEKWIKYYFYILSKHIFTHYILIQSLELYLD